MEDAGRSGLARELMKPITVLLCDDHTVVRQGLRLLLEAAEDLQVIGEAENGHQSVAEAERLQPDVVLLDLAMPLLNGVEAARRITRRVPSVKVLILSSYSHPQDVQQAIEAGAAGYLMKQAAGNDLLCAIHEVHRGNAFFSPLISRQLSEQRRRADSQFHTGSRSRLSVRQMDVLKLIADGYANKQIAALLSIANKTVEKHRQILMHKLDIHNIAALTRYAVSSGVVRVNHPPHPLIATPFAHEAVNKNRAFGM
jgi:DNA-binding NarL/FixJ family response regulator